MKFIPEITCRNCGKKFSAIHARCPNCGTRHVKQTFRSTPATSAAAEAARTPSGSRQAASNARWQLIFGGILVAAVIIAVIILITASLEPSSKTKPVETPAETVEITPPPTTPPPTPTPVPTVAVTSISITFLGRQVTEFTQRITWAPIQLAADVYPKEALADAKLIWRSSDDSICTVDDTGLVTAVGSGTCEIIAECGGMAANCKVLVP